MKITGIVFILMVLSSCCYGFDRWDTYDVLLYVGAEVALLADVYTTERGLDKGGYERNRIHSKHPSDTRLVLWFIWGSVGRFVAAHILPSPWRKVFLTTSMCVNAGYARRNYITIKCKF